MRSSKGSCLSRVVSLVPKGHFPTSAPALPAWITTSRAPKERRASARARASRRRGRDRATGSLGTLAAHPCVGLRKGVGAQGRLPRPGAGPRTPAHAAPPRPPRSGRRRRGPCGTARCPPLGSPPSPERRRPAEPRVPPRAHPGEPRAGGRRPSGVRVRTEAAAPSEPAGVRKAPPRGAGRRGSARGRGDAAATLPRTHPPDTYLRALLGAPVGPRGLPDPEPRADRLPGRLRRLSAPQPPASAPPGSRQRLPGAARSPADTCGPTRPERRTPGSWRRAPRAGSLEGRAPAPTSPDMNQTAGASNNVRCPPGKGPKVRGREEAVEAAAREPTPAVCGAGASGSPRIAAAERDAVLESRAQRGGCGNRWRVPDASPQSGRCTCLGSAAHGGPGARTPAASARGSARAAFPPDCGVLGGRAGEVSGRQRLGNQSVTLGPEPEEEGDPGRRLGLGGAHARLGVRDTCLINCNGPRACLERVPGD